MSPAQNNLIVILALNNQEIGTEGVGEVVGGSDGLCPSLGYLDLGYNWIEAKVLWGLLSCYGRPVSLVHGVDSF